VCLRVGAVSLITIDCRSIDFLSLKENNAYAYVGYGRAIVQAVSRWLPTAAPRVRARFWSSGICGGQSGAGADFLWVLRFSLPIFIPPNSPSSYSPGGDTVGHSVADVPGGPSLDSTPHYANHTRAEAAVSVSLVISRRCWLHEL
jgi:hypothetical protein